MRIALIGMFVKKINQKIQCLINQSLKEAQTIIPLTGSTVYIQLGHFSLHTVRC